MRRSALYVLPALFLVLNFMALAVLYLLLNAQVLAFLQILVYAGAVMVLFLFVIMLLNLGGETATTDPLVGQRFVGLILGLCLSRSQSGDKHCASTYSCPVWSCCGGCCAWA